MDDERQKLMVRLEQAVWCFSRSLTRHLLSAREDEAAYANDCRAKLRPELADALIAARHKPTRALYELSTAIGEFPIDERRKISMDASVTVLCDSMGGCERIFTSPVPRFFTRHTARFLELWLFIAPFGLYEAFRTTWNHWGM
jgi:ion channel-forming bestrophin family protein